MLELRTINDIVSRMGRRDGETVALWKSGAEWKPITARTMYGRVRAVAQALEAWGIKRGDRVALMSENRWGWPVVDFAALAMGAVDVPMYQTLTPEQVGYMLRDSGSRVIFVSNKGEYEKVVAAGEIPTLEHMVVFDEGEFPGAESFSKLLEPAPGLERVDEEFEKKLGEAKPEELATLIYTSGTTGDPKGVMLTHRNLADNLRHSTDDLQIQKGDVVISFLPLSHALARHLDYAIYAHGGVLAYLKSFDELPRAMKDVKPMIFLAVPRVFEKVRQSVEGKAHGFQKRILNWALKQGAGHKDEVAAGKEPRALGWKLANRLVFAKIRAAFGGNVRLFISGGAPLGRETTEWFLGVGIRIFEGYGLTETSPVISRNTFAGYRPNTVGTIIPNLELRLAEDGEIEARGSSVFAGYWKNEEATKKEFTPDGWFKTGDIGKLEDGFLSITDRKKELMKTSGGKYVAPQPIEGKLKADALVGQAALVGDQRKFVSVLISPNFEALERWAKENGVSGGDRAKLVADPKVQKLYKDLVSKVNAGLAPYETVKKVGVVAEEWTVESGELTPSMKLKRRVIVDKYKERIEAFYA
ncbi:MAG TPA: long-chain fatty acid--CoA ligase [Acidobacteriaceae bacterium]|jgi:long-chain acyl-CoA synthetase|nr:long-chain fatty acid--CoA ligase [Acidobacteriaceae bacterium]